MQRANLMLEAAAMLAVSAAGRSILRHTESRWQIAGWCIAAVLLEIVSREQRPAMRIVRPLALCAAAAIGVSGVKAFLEPHAVRADAHLVRAHAKAVARKVAPGA